MRNNDWGMSEFPFVGGHEAVGEIVGVGENVKGWRSAIRSGLAGMRDLRALRAMSFGLSDQLPGARGTIVERHGGFADRVRCNWDWAIKLPDRLDASKAGPLFCGGITVFNPFVQLDIKPTDKVGVIGIGGLGHLALQFADKWGCEVTAFYFGSVENRRAKSAGRGFCGQFARRRRTRKVERQIRYDSFDRQRFA